HNNAILSFPTRRTYDLKKMMMLYYQDLMKKNLKMNLKKIQFYQDLKILKKKTKMKKIQYYQGLKILKKKTKKKKKQSCQDLMKRSEEHTSELQSRFDLV